MFEFIGFVISVLFCAAFFISGLMFLYIASIFSDRTSAVGGLILICIASLGSYKLYHNSPYEVSVKSHQVNDAKTNIEINQKDK